MGEPKVLLIEDDPDVALISEATLTRAGYDVVVAVSVDEAIRACEKTVPDLVLIDLQLPERSGWEFVRHVRDGSRFGGMRLVVYSVHSDEPENVEQARRLKVDALIGKSGDPADLVASVRQLLG